MSIRTIWLAISLGFISLLSTTNAQANMPSCSSTYGGFCSYTGKVANLYVNSGNIILIYFDTAMDPANASVAGFSISVGNAAAVNISDNPEFAKLLYSTALAAQMSQKNISIQMRGNIGGYLKIDRIWLAE